MALVVALCTGIKCHQVQAYSQCTRGKDAFPMKSLPRSRNTTPFDDLSTREIEILRRVASGCSNKIVADKLGISEDTVKGHMKSVLAKLQAKDRTHAVMIAMKRGFLDK